MFVMRFGSMYRIRIPIALKVQCLFLQFKSGALHFADDIFYLHKGFYCCDGQNSVPAMRMCCDEISPFRMICYRFTNFVEPTSKQCYSHQSHLKLLATESAHLLEPKITKSASDKFSICALHLPL
jgi:hypothetical protein